MSFFEASAQLAPAPREPRLRRRHGGRSQSRDLHELVAHGVEEHRRRTVGVHLRHVAADPFELVARAELRLERRRGSPLGVARAPDLLGAIDHAPLAPPGSKRVQAHVAREDGRPPGEAAVAREGPLRERRHDLLEGRLHEIGMVVLAAPEDAHNRRVDDRKEAVVEPHPRSGLPRLEGLDELLVLFGSYRLHDRDGDGGAAFGHEAQARAGRMLDERLRRHMASVPAAAYTRLEARR